MKTRRKGRPALFVATAGLLLAALSGDAEECRKKICRGDYHLDGKVCRSVSGLNWRSHYTPDLPLCPAGWDVAGGDCVKKVCCEKPVCKPDDRYRDGYCWSGPSGVGGYRSHSEARCPAGWEFDREKGVCKNPECKLTAPGIVMQPWAPFQITGFGGGACVRKGGQLTILGNGFGDVPGPNAVEIGGHGVGLAAPVVSWSSHRIVVTVPNDARLVAGQWYYAGLKNDRGNWISGIDKTFTICR
ncbi:MAG: IPT/TIG domain-containing protein [Acidobacteriota bacterium]